MRLRDLDVNTVPEQFEKFLADVKQIISRLLSFLSPQQKRLIFIGLPTFTVFDRLRRLLSV